VAPILEAVAAAGRELAAAASVADKTLGDKQSGGKPEFHKGRLVGGGADAVAAPFGDALRALNMQSVTGQGSAKGTFMSAEKPKFSSHSFGAHFVEVVWRPELAQLRVSRVVTVIDAGRIINPLAALNQIQGAVVMGIGMALFEKTEYDPVIGAPVNASLADYLLPTHADVPALETRFVDFPDYNLNPLGARGVGEIGLAGVAAAITNAVRHATGVRIRNLPLEIESLL
jgi:xanthine dehydrogenase YagR molybdenum-binding subunit